MTVGFTAVRSSANRSTLKGLRQYLNPEQQRGWMEGETNLADAAERSQSLEQRFNYAARLEKLLRRPQIFEYSGQITVSRQSSRSP